MGLPNSRAFRRAVVVGVLLTAVGPAACRRAPAESEASRSTPSGGARLATPYPITPFEALDLNGRRVALAEWKGQVVVINVWATWCAPCRRELPALARIEARYQGRVRLLGLLQDKVTDEFARKFVANTGVTFPIVRSSFDIEQRLPAVLVFPMTFVIDRAGRLIATFAGEVDLAELDREIVRLLAPPN